MIPTNERPRTEPDDTEARDLLGCELVAMADAQLDDVASGVPPAVAARYFARHASGLRDAARLARRRTPSANTRTLDEWLTAFADAEALRIDPARDACRVRAHEPPPHSPTLARVVLGPDPGRGHRATLASVRRWIVLVGGSTVSARRLGPFTHARALIVLAERRRTRAVTTCRLARCATLGDLSERTVLGGPGRIEPSVPSTMPGTRASPPTPLPVPRACIEPASTTREPRPDILSWLDDAAFEVEAGMESFSSDLSWRREQGELANDLAAWELARYCHGAMRALAVLTGDRPGVAEMLATTRDTRLAGFLPGVGGESWRLGPSASRMLAVVERGADDPVPAPPTPHRVRIAYRSRFSGDREDADEAVRPMPGVVGETGRARCGRSADVLSLDELRNRRSGR